MSDGFVVICEDDGITYGVGATEKDAWQDAEEWILDAVRDTVSDHRLGKEPLKALYIDLSWKVHPATKALVDSVGAMGGHDKWKARPDGVLDLAFQVGEDEPFAAEADKGGA